MFNFGFVSSFVQQRFRVFEKDKQLINENREKQEFDKVDSQIDLRKLANRADASSISAWAGKSQINGSIAQSVKEAGTGIGADRMISGGQLT